MKSESIKNISPALCKAQSEIKSILLDAVNPFYNSKYATLGELIRKSRPVLEKNGLTVSQLTIGKGGEIGVATLLMHTSGEWIDSALTIPLPASLEVVGGKAKRNNLAQEAGKVITYLRRYSLAAILNIYADEDTDAQDPTTKKETKKETVKKEERPYSPEKVKTKITKGAETFVNDKASVPQRKLMLGMLEACFAVGDTSMKRKEVCQYLTGFGSSKDIPDNYVLALLKWISAKKDSGGAYKPGVHVSAEASKILVVRLKELGQLDL